MFRQASNPNPRKPPKNLVHLVLIQRYPFLDTTLIRQAATAHIPQTNSSSIYFPPSSFCATAETRIFCQLLLLDIPCRYLARIRNERFLIDQAFGSGINSEPSPSFLLHFCGDFWRPRKSVDSSSIRRFSENGKVFLCVRAALGGAPAFVRACGCETKHPLKTPL